MKKILIILMLLLCGCSVEKGIKNDENLKICLLLTGNLGDMSFLDSANAGILQIEEKYGASTKVIEMGTDTTKYLTELLDASDEGYDIIIGSSFKMQETIEQVAPKYPDVKYIIFDGQVDYEKEDFSNVYSILYRQNEGAFLAGALAGYMTKTGYIGFLGGQQGVGIDDFAVGFTQGAKYVNPEMQVSVSYVGSFDDSARCKELALAHFNQGIDIIFAVCGASGLGAIDAGFETENLIIGVDSDQAMFYDGHEKANYILTSVLKDVGTSLVEAIELYLKDELPFGSVQSVGIFEKTVSISKNKYYKELVSVEIQEKIDKIEEKIINGEIIVQSAYD